MNSIKIVQTYCRNVAALFIVVLLVSCGGGGGNSQSLNINANAGTNQNVTPGTLVTLNGSASTSLTNTHTLIYSWILTSRPTGSTAVLTGATTAAPTFTADLAGAYVATLVVSDGTVNSNTATVTITAITLPSGYVSQGGLVWMPPAPLYTWANADAYCTTFTINGQSRWRMPTKDELKALYDSGVINGQGWALTYTWSSTWWNSVGSGLHYFVDLTNGNIGWSLDMQTYYVSCVL